MSKIYELDGDRYHSACLRREQVSLAKELNLGEIEEEDICAFCGEGFTPEEVEEE